jgi:asparagine synthase (glutamine-hydrolysing)
MCGISGFINISYIHQPIEVIGRMNAALSHRGPDGEGVYLGNGFVFGHRRLSIVDLSIAGHQPMHYLNRYTITFNGEIYNYKELRQELEDNGYIFSSQTDTEVIMAAYHKWGEACLIRFNGMWAFVIYDSDTQKFFISRDRFGKKPLYYYQSDRSFIFASDIKAIFEHPEAKKAPNLKYLRRYFEIGPREYLKETAFENIFRFPNASYLIATRKELIGDIKAKEFWVLKPNLSKEKFCAEKANHLAEQYYKLLSDSVRMRLRADVKIGSALSGGLDSSSIVFLVNQHLKELGKTELQETFSSVYKTKGTEDCDESSFINLLADYLQVNTNQIEPKEADIPEEHSKLIKHMENPPDSSCMSGWHTFKKVSKSDVKVTLDGQGADEQMAGYVGFIQPYLVSLSIPEFYRELPYYMHFPHIKNFLMNHCVSNLLMNILGASGYRILFNRILKKNRAVHLNQALVDATMSSLLNLITWADRESMAYSIESRMPFMDFRLVEFLASVPACYKMHRGWTKYIARLAFDKKLPDEIVWRKDKMGWPIPEEHWFKGGLSTWFNKTRDESKLLQKLKSESGAAGPMCLVNEVRGLNIAVFEKELLKGSNS